MILFIRQYLFLILSIHITEIHAQQLPIFTQYAENIGLLNPSSLHHEFLYYESNVSFHAHHRSQWLSLPSSPSTSSAKGELILRREKGFDLLSSLYMMHDSDGQISTTGLYGRVAMINQVNKYNNVGGFSLGLLFGMVQYRVPNLQDIAIDPDDRLLFDNAQTQLFPQVGLGVSFQHQFLDGILENDRIQIGLSAPQMFALDVNFRNEDRSLDLTRTPHYYATLQYTRMVDDQSFFEFATWLKYVNGVPLHADVIAKVYISHIIWLGLGASTASIAHGEFGIRLTDNIGIYDGALTVSYGFDRGLKSFGPIFGATHEFIVSYHFNSY